MKRLLLHTLIASAMLMPFSSTVTAAPATSTTQTYTLDPMHTYVLWHISHFGFSSPSGKWTATGTLVLDEKNPKNSQVKASIKMDTIDTGLPTLDEHLRGKAFFDVEHFPTATFVSDKVIPTGKNTAKVHGMLTLHGVTKTVTLDVTLNKAGINPITTKQAVGFSAKTTIKRSEFDITTLLPGLGDTVKLEIEAEAELS